MRADKTPEYNTKGIAHLMGGFVGGVVATFSLHPFEVLKTRLAVNDGSLSERIIHRYTGIGNALRVIYTRNGVKGFYQGVSPNLIGSSFSWGVFLFLYEKLKSHLSTDSLRLQHQILSASLSGVITLTLANPIWVVKTRMILQPSSALENVSPRLYYYRGVWHALSTIWRGEGLQGLYRGYIAGVLGVSHGVVQIVSYDRLKTGYRKYNNINSHDSVALSTPAYLMLSAISKVSAVVTTYPYQVLRFRIQSNNQLYKGIIQTTLLTARNEGVYGFYKGLLPSILRVTPATCITMLIYEYTLMAHRYVYEA